MKSKKIYLEPAWKLHSLYNSLIQNPPDGYEIISSQSLDNKVFKSASKMRQAYRVLELLDNGMPSTLIKSRLERFKKIPKETDLTYACGHLVFRKEPWIVDMEYLSILVGFNPKHFQTYKKLIESTLSSDYCKKIITWFEASKRTILLNLDCSNFESKLEVVSFAGKKRDFTKIVNNDKIKLLFVNSGNIPLQFYYKGGMELLEAFSILSRKFGNLELVIRSDMPKDLKDKFKSVKNLKIINKVVPWDVLENEFKTADIFLYPTYSSEDMVVFDAMSYELPVIITDVFANSEVVENGKTGFVISRAKTGVYYYREDFIGDTGRPESQFAKLPPDTTIVQNLVNQTTILIENKEMRRQMGKAGRWEVEHGKFSIERRNEKLKRIFDEATA